MALGDGMLRLSRKRGMFADSDQDPNVKALRMCSPEYLSAFHACDPNGTGFIDLQHLSAALQAVQAAAEVGGFCQNVSMRQFHSSTCCFLCTRFGDGSRLSAFQFCELLYYLHNLRLIFTQLDADRSGGIGCGELHRAFQLSGADMDAGVVAQILGSYDADQSKALEFDEFVQFRLEWDHYISAWDLCTRGAPIIEPGQLLAVLEEIKRATEPVGSALVALGLSLRYIFHAHRPFQAETCERLIVRFGQGSYYLSFEQFCNVMVSLKEMKAAFCGCDAERSGSLSIEELAAAMTRLGMDLPSPLVVQIGQRYAASKAGEIEFDEFVQMMVEWNEVWRERWRFGGAGAGRIGPAQLREVLGSVRVIYRVVNGVVQVARPFNVHTCRWLVAKFGTCLVGEAFAQGLTWAEFLSLVMYLKDAHSKFYAFTQPHSGFLSADELGAAMATCGIQLSHEAIDNIRRSYDVDGSGTFEFDEFLQLILECQLYDQVFDIRAAYPSIPTPLCTQRLALAPPAAGASGLISLDKSAFFSLVFAVPRHVGRERGGAAP